MYRYPTLIFSALFLTLALFSSNCQLKNCAPDLPNPGLTATNTSTQSFTPTQTPTGTPSPTLTQTPTNSPTNTPTSTPTCVSYSDDFSNAGTLTNYDYFMNSTQASTTAAGAGYQIGGGLLEVAPAGTGNNGGLAIIDNTFFSHSITDYTITADFEMDSYAGNLGIFGIAFRTGANGSFYCFQWNGDFSTGCGGTQDWEIEKNTGSPSVGFSYLGSCSTSSGYVLGTTVTLKVIVSGNNFLCYVDNNLIYNVTDNSSPFTSGGVGVRTYGIGNPNVARIDNLSVKTADCP